MNNFPAHLIVVILHYARIY